MSTEKTSLKDLIQKWIYQTPSISLPQAVEKVSLEHNADLVAEVKSLGTKLIESEIAVQDAKAHERAAQKGARINSQVSVNQARTIVGLREQLAEAKKHAKECIIHAFEAAYIQGHNDTEEGKFNPSHDFAVERAQEAVKAFESATLEG